MQKIAFGLPTALSALVLVTAAPNPAAAQNAAPAGTQIQSTVPGLELRPHIRLVSARAALIRSYHAAGDRTQAASQTWRENPSLMDFSWRLWPSLVDF
jgi:hypothetical protein